MMIMMLVAATMFALLTIIVDLRWRKSRSSSRFYSVMSKVSTLIGSLLCLYVIQGAEQTGMTMQMYLGILLLGSLLFVWPVVKFFLAKNG